PRVHHAARRRGVVAGDGARAAARPNATHRRAHARRLRQPAISGLFGGVPAGIAATGLDRRPQCNAARAVSGHPPSWSRRSGQPSVLTPPNPISTLLQRFACACLSQPCLPGSCPDVSATLTTTAFDRSSLRWLEIST